MTTLSIPDMSCDHCKATIEKTIHSLDPAASLNFDMAGRTLAVQSQASIAALRDALRVAGYEATAA